MSKHDDTSTKAEPAPAQAPRTELPAAIPEPVNLTEQNERLIAIGWAAAGLITEAERDQRLAAIRRRYHGGR